MKLQIIQESEIRINLKILDRIETKVLRAVRRFRALELGGHKRVSNIEEKY